jgi:hypothetical protein
VPVAYDWGFGLYASLALGLVGMVLGARFGGRIDDIDVRDFSPDPAASPSLSPDESHERILH